MARSAGAGFRDINRRRGSIPGVTGKRVPGNARLSRPAGVGGFRTRVPSAQPYSMSSANFREFHKQQVRDVRGRFAGGWGFAWQGLEDVANNIENFNKDLHGKIDTAVRKLADEMLAYMQANAPWNDRTPEERAHAGDPAEGARASLQAVVVKETDETWTIFLGHGKNIYYGIWLEVRWGGKNAIILPTVYYFAPQIGDRIRTLT